MDSDILNTSCPPTVPPPGSNLESPPSSSNADAGVVTSSTLSEPPLASSDSDHVPPTAPVADALTTAGGVGQPIDDVVPEDEATGCHVVVNPFGGVDRPNDDANLGDEDDVEDEFSDFIGRLLIKWGLPPSLERKKDLAMWLLSDPNGLSEDYHNRRYLIAQKILSDIDNLNLRLPNGSFDKPYDLLVDLQPLPVTVKNVYGISSSGSRVDITSMGLNASIDLCSCRICGTPNDVAAKVSKIVFELDYEGRLPDEPLLCRSFNVVFNPDPRKLMKDLPTPADIPYFKPDTDTFFSHFSDVGRSLVAASLRGRSHANDGKARDDHFKLHRTDNGWFILVVSDGAGSARFSREGSRIACETSVDRCSKALDKAALFEEHIQHYADCVSKDDDNGKKGAGQTISRDLYDILCSAAFDSFKEIEAEAKRYSAALSDSPSPSSPVSVKDYAATYELLICKKFSFGWALASVWIGDGCIAVYDKNSTDVGIMGKADEGEFSGQTRFLTMREVVKDLSPRMRFKLVKDFSAIVLMTDGVSDPVFETDQNASSKARWDEFWQWLSVSGFPDERADWRVRGVDLDSRSPEVAQQLLSWLGFWSAGNHDDRTIALLY